MAERKIYAIYAKLILTDEPDWLQGFRSKYDKPFDLHITLKQMAYVDEAAVNDIQDVLESCLADHNLPKDSIGLEFDKLVEDESDMDTGTGFLYVFATKRNPYLDELQLQLRQRLAVYSDYFFKGSYRYEHDFQPHITIARELNSDTLKSAVKELPEDMSITGKIESIVLSCLVESRIGEQPKPDELTVFELNKF